MRRVAIVGTGQTKFVAQRKDANHPEVVFEATTKALQDAKISMDDVEAVVYGVMDPFDGIDCTDRWCGGAAGGINKPFLRINTAGTTGNSAAASAYYHVASGMYDMVIAVCQNRMSECTDAQSLLNTGTCPVHERAMGMGAISLGSLPATRHMQLYGSTHEQRALVAVKSRRNGLNNPYAHLRQWVTLDDVLSSPIVDWPLRLLECCPRSDGAAAAIFACEDIAKHFDGPVAWVNGLTSIADSYYFGDRNDIAYRDSLALAARRLYRQTGIRNPLEEIDVAELYIPFASLELIKTEALGFCEVGKGGQLVEDGVTWMEGKLPINPSGGVLCSNPIGATGLVRIIEGANQVRGTAGSCQVPGAETALCSGVGGVVQFHSLMLLGSTPR